MLVVGKKFPEIERKGNLGKERRKTDEDTNFGKPTMVIRFVFTGVEIKGKKRIKNTKKKV